MRAPAASIRPRSAGTKAKPSGSSVIREAQELTAASSRRTASRQGIRPPLRGRLRYCHHTGAWFEWTGTHWRKDETALAFQFCRELAREFTADCQPTEMKEVRKVSFAGGVEKFAKSDRAMAVTSEIWDRDPFLLGTPGGTVDLRTGELREPDPADGITKITAVAPAETADCPRWLQFLDETFGDDRADPVHPAMERLLPDRRHQRARAGVRVRQRRQRQSRYG